MNDDWRLRVRLHEHGIIHALSERLAVADLEHDLERAFADRVIVSIDGAELFCYAGTREQAEAAASLIRSVADQHGWAVETELSRWHPSAERWAGADAPLPETDAERIAERAELVRRERQESAARGYPEYEIRVECETREAASELADQLWGQGLPSVQRFRYVLLGAVDEQSATQLAEQVRGMVPAGTPVSVGASLRAVHDETARSPFAVFGGLGG
jgi:hypothetical protein